MAEKSGHTVVVSDEDAYGLSQTLSWAAVRQAELLKIEEVCVLVGISRAQVYRAIGDPDLAFPRPVKIGRASRGMRREVMDWIAHMANRARG